MSFLAPLTLIGLALLVLPVLIHLLTRRRAVRLDFPSLRSLRETPSFRLRPRRVREPLLLALRLAALALLIAGLARPFLSSNAGHTRTRVILLDASLSMLTRGRAEAAREQARAIINRLGQGERASLVAFTSAATVLAEATAERAALLKALEGYEPVGGAADYSAAFAAATQMLKREPPGSAEIDLISDFQQSGLLAHASRSQTVAKTTVPVNTFAVGSQVERNAFLADEAVVRAASAVELSATEIVTGPEGQAATRRTWTIDANDAVGSGGAVSSGGALADLEWHTQSNGQVTGFIRTNVPDDLDADDQRFFAFTPPREARALLIETESDGPYLRAALEASGVDGAAHLALERRKELPPSSDDLAPYALVVITLHGAAEPEVVRVLTDYARAGGAVWLCLARDLDVEGWNRLALAEQASALPFVSLARMEPAAQPFSPGPTDSAAPALKFMGEGALAALRALRVREGYKVTPRENAATLARWSDGTPALVSAEVGAGSLLLLATSTEREASELGLSPALPALAASILSAATLPREPISRETGEPLQLGLHPATEVSVTDLAGRTTFVRARELAQRSPDIFRAPGVYRIEFAGQQRFLAFNTPVRESARALATPDEIKSYLAQTERGAAGAAATMGPQSTWREAAERRGQLWRLLLGVAFLLLVAELFIYTRGARQS